MLNNKDVINFIIEAKKNTYANGKIEDISSRPGSRDFIYKKNINNLDLKYHDVFFGGLKFIGEEILYINDTPYWGMNYNGETIDNTVSEKLMDSILKPALLKVGEDNILPVRGPKIFKNGDYTYSFNVEGKLENFDGKEEIYKNDKLIFKLTCKGDTIL